MGIPIPGKTVFILRRGPEPLRKWTTHSTSLTLWRRDKNGRHFADDIFKFISLNEDVLILIKNSLAFVSKGSIYNIPALVQIMVGRPPPGDNPWSEPMMTHICTTRPQKSWEITVHPIKCALGFVVLCLSISPFPSRSCYFFTYTFLHCYTLFPVCLLSGVLLQLREAIWAVKQTGAF